MTTSSCSARRIAAAICCCFLCAVLVFTSSATDYLPQSYYFSLYASGQSYTGCINDIEVSGASGRSTTGTFTVPLNLSDQFKWLYIGANYRSVSYDVGAQYKFVITLTFGTTGSYNKTFAPSLYSAQLKSGLSPLIDHSSLSTVSANGTLTSGSGNSYTFTYDNITYDSVVGNTFFCVNIPLAYLDSISELDIHIVNTYFGLESYYDEDKYNSQMLDNLGNIQSAIEEGNNKLDNIAGAVDDVGNKVDNAADQISGDLNDLEDAIINQPQEEMDIADQKGSAASDSADSALNDSGLTPNVGNIWTGLTTLFNSVSTTDTVDYIPIPEVKLPSLSSSIGSTPEIVLIPEQQYDISLFLQNDHIQLLIKGAKVLYYIFFAIFIIDYCRKLIAKISLDDVDVVDSSRSNGRPNLY